MVLVTGGTGLLGSALVQRLRDDGQQVRVLSREAHAHVGAGECVSGDVADPNALREAMRGVERVFHLAALVDHCASDDDLERVNVAGTVGVAAAALSAGVRRMIHLRPVGRRRSSRDSGSHKGQPPVDGWHQEVGDVHLGGPPCRQESKDDLSGDPATARDFHFSTLFPQVNFR